MEKNAIYTSALVERGCPKSAEVLRRMVESVGEEPDAHRILEAARRGLAKLELS